MKTTKNESRSEVTTVRKNIANNCYSRINVTKTVKSLIFMVFMWNATAFPFYAAFAANPEIITPEVNARVLVPQSNSVYKNITPVTAACNYYDATDTTGTWNNKFTSKGKRLTNGETQNLTFPLPSFEYKDDSGTKHSVNVTAADVDRYYEYEKFTAANGYTKISGASLAMNCHGYSTGLGYWMDDFDTLMSDDYTSSTTPSNLAVGAIKGDDSHSIKITEISTTMSGEVFYKVIKTREKFHASGVYEKAITDEKYYENDTVPYLFYTKN